MADAQFCGRCGGRLIDADVPAPQYTHVLRRVLATSVVLVVVAFAIVGSVAVWRALRDVSPPRADVEVPEGGLPLSRDRENTEPRCEVDGLEQPCVLWRVPEGAGVVAARRVGDELIYLNSGGTIASIDPDDGTFLWATATTVPAAGARAFLPSMPRDDRVILRRPDVLVFLDADTGDILGRHRGQLEMATHDVLAFIEGLTEAPEVEFVSLNSGETLGEWPLEPVADPSGICERCGEHIVNISALVVTHTEYPDTDPVVRGRDLVTGEIVWSVDARSATVAPGPRRFRNAFERRSTQLTFTREDTAAIAARDISTGDIVWVLDSVGTETSIAAITDDVLVLRSRVSDDLTVIDLATGLERFSFTTGVGASVTPSPDGEHLIVSEQPDVAFRVSSVDLSTGEAEWIAELEAGDSVTAHDYVEGALAVSRERELTLYDQAGRVTFEFLAQRDADAVRIVSISPLVVATRDALYGIDPEVALAGRRVDG